MSFLRKLRIPFFNQGRVQNYLIYAIGEIILVVVGILIAIQLNQWNNKRVARSENREILEELIQNLDKDIERLDLITVNSAGTDMNGWNTLEESVEYCSRAMTFMDSPANIAKIDSIFLYRLDTGGPLLNTETNIYEQLKSTGRLYTLGSKKLRQAITVYYSKAAQEEHYNIENTEALQWSRKRIRFVRSLQLRQSSSQFDPAAYPWIEDQNAREYDLIFDHVYMAWGIQAGTIVKMQSVMSMAEELKALLEAELDQ